MADPKTGTIAEELNKLKSVAADFLKDDEKMEELLQRMEQKLKIIPKLGETLSALPVFVSLVRSYIKKEYTKVPFASIISIVAAIIYVVAPVDLIPDAIPVLGITDDATAVLLCLKFVKSDVDEYEKWRNANGKA